MYSKDAMQIYDYSTSGGKNLILEYIKDLPDALKAEILDTRQLIREKGIDAFLLLTTRQLYKKLWEIKISQERIMYVIQDQESVYFLNICNCSEPLAYCRTISAFPANAAVNAS